MNTNKNSAKTDLLERLRMAANCEYLSNLFYGVSFGKIGMLLLSIPPETYTFDQWQEMAQYFLRAPNTFASAQEIKDFLVEFGKDKTETPAQLQEAFNHMTQEK